MAKEELITRISVIIVNYGTPDLTIAGVQSVLDRSHGGRDVDVHVVDNASPDDSAEQLTAAHAAQGWGDRVTLYLETENHGFGRGNNVALKALHASATPPDAVFLLNPDARLETETLDVLAKALDANPKIAICGSKITRTDGTFVTAAFRFPTVFGEFLAGLGIGKISNLFAGHKIALPPDIPAGPVDWVSGASFMARMDALAEVDFFDPAYFLYFEETDLMFRLRKRGYEIWHIAQASVVHEAGAATGMQAGKHKSGTKPRYWYDSCVLYFLQTGGLKHANAAGFARRLGLRLNLLISALRGRDGAVARQELDYFSKQRISDLARNG